MKTVSQNTPTIYSATTPENNPPQLVASLVPDEQRISFWPQHFGLIHTVSVTLGPCLRWMDRLCEDYCGGIWNLYTLNNGPGHLWHPNRMMMTKHGYCSMHER